MVWSTFVVAFSWVDPIAPLFLYFTIPIILWVFVASDKGGLIGKIFLILLVFSHVIVYLSFSEAQKNSTLTQSSKPFNHDRFMKCSEAMFNGGTDEQKKLSIEQKIKFDHCLNQ